MSKYLLSIYLDKTASKSFNCSSLDLSSGLYFSFGNLDKDVRRHELVAVEYGTNLEAVTDALIHAVSDDLAGTPEYASYKTAAFAPAPVKEFRRVRRYDYEMTGIVYPPYADKNILTDYGIIEESELEK